MRNLNQPHFRVVPDDRNAIARESHIELESITAIGDRPIKGRKGVFTNGSEAACSAMAKQQRAAHVRTPKFGSVKVEVPDGLSGIRSFLRLLERLLEFFLQQIGCVLLRLHGLLKDGFAAVILFPHGLGGGFHIGESLGFYRRSVGDDSLGLRINLQYGAAARAGHFKGGGFLRHLSESYRKCWASCARAGNLQRVSSSRRSRPSGKGNAAKSRSAYAVWNRSPISAAFHPECKLSSLTRLRQRETHNCA